MKEGILISVFVALFTGTAFSQELLPCKFVGHLFVCSEQETAGTIPSTATSDLPNTVVCGATFYCPSDPIPGSTFIEIPEEMVQTWRTNRSSVFAVFPSSPMALTSEQKRQELEQFRIGLETSRLGYGVGAGSSYENNLAKYRLGIDAYKNSIEVIRRNVQ